MDIGSILLIFALLAVVAWFIARPFIDHPARKSTRRSREKQAFGQRYSSLLAERDRVLNSLQELDFDFALGKIPDDDYPAQRAVLLQQGASILRELDTFQATPDAETAEARLEAVIAARRAALTPAYASGNGKGNGVHPPDDDIETQIAARKRAHEEKASGFCPQCGSPIKKSDRFCPRCGASV
jgi:anion-transporting  ArsA/GET3 family ATPase